ncbi:hypothetical protein IHC92_20710 [Photobacterium damselae subsp. damselae]|uniref:hypothetical protein n=1 Tax=Photobacterium damselae TaxID=38293 RepID=UPI001F3C3F70|nr:hypothetical protein [Photobacterium damselae]UKA23376.1 hypothetical protein IHC92_20710 [Photobacterium damselae subsp. damselae]
MRREQLKAISKYKILSGAKSNAYKTIQRLDASKNKANLDFEANLKNTMIGTLSYEIMESLGDSEHADEIEIKWLPSESAEHRINHALQYGKTMSLKRAKSLGLGVDYGCKCGMQIIKGHKHIKSFISKIEKGEKL